MTDVGLEMFIMEREVVLHEEEVARRRRRRWLRATGFAVGLTTLASGSGLAAAGTSPAEAAQASVEFLFPGDPPPPDGEPTTPPEEPITAADEIGTDAGVEADVAPAVTPAPKQEPSTPEAPPAQANLGNSENAPGHTDDGGTAPGNSGAHGNPSPPGFSGDHGNPEAPGQAKKATP